MKREKTEGPPLLISPELASALANSWRNRILMEVHQRPMSPKTFADEFASPGLTTVARYFRELKEWGFLEVAEELRGGARRGAIEKIYRGIQRVYFDTPTWEALPLYLRTECSGVVLEGLLQRITHALKANTFDAEKDRHLSWKAVYLDRPAWNEFIEGLDEILYWISEIEAESTARLVQSGGEPIPMTVALLSFRSPLEDFISKEDLIEGSSSQGSPKSIPFLLSPQTAKALANPWRNRILMELHLRPMSPKQFGDEFGGPELTTLARYFRQLKDWGYLEIVKELRGGARRGAVEKVYRAIKRAYFSTAIWEDLPPSLRTDCSGAVLESLVYRIHQAVSSETFDLEKDRHLSWKSLWLDRQAWEECVTRLDEALAWLFKLESQAQERLGASQAEVLPATVGLMAFRSPRSA